MQTRMGMSYITLDKCELIYSAGIRAKYKYKNLELAELDYYQISVLYNDLMNFIQSQIGWVQYTSCSDLIEEAPMSVASGIAFIQKEWEVKIFTGDNELYRDLGRCQVVVDMPELEESYSMTAVVPIPIRIIPIDKEVE